MSFFSNEIFLDKLIGVHCTHGLNRSGFMICRYMIEEMKIPPIDAISGEASFFFTMTKWETTHIIDEFFGLFEFGSWFLRPSVHILLFNFWSLSGYPNKKSHTKIYWRLLVFWPNLKRIIFHSIKFFCNSRIFIYEFPRQTFAVKLNFKI